MERMRVIKNGRRKSSGIVAQVACIVFMNWAKTISDLDGIKDCNQQENRTTHNQKAVDEWKEKSGSSEYTTYSVERL